MSVPDLIGVFDSGLGGLTAVREIERVLPAESIVYFGDTGRVPYGTRSRETIVKYACQDVRFLSGFPLKALVVACGTVSSIALEELRRRVNVPLVDALSPAAKAAAKATRNGRIGILGTSATVSSGALEAHLKALGDFRTRAVACPLFVPLVENGLTGKDCLPTRLIARDYLAPLQEFGCDTVILGCTHFPLLQDVLADELSQGVTLIDSGREAALALKDLLEQKGLTAAEGRGSSRFFASDSAAHFEALAGRFLGRSLEGEVCRIDIETY